MTTEVSLFAAFGAGLVAFFSPCIVPVLPAYLTTLAGSGSRRTLIVNALMFVLGFFLVFTAMGVTASWLGQYISLYKGLITRLSGLVIIIFGLHMSGLIKLPLLYREARATYRPVTMTPFAALGMGMVFSLGWTPCVGPVLASVLVLAASQSTSLWGGLLLSIFSLGMGIPFMLAATFLGGLLSRKEVLAALPVVNRVAGWLLVALGVLLAMDKVNLLMIS